jgi:hypothetical protein
MKANRVKNEHKPWSETELFDLQSNLARGDLIEETAALLMRREDEVRQKVRELRQAKAAGRAHETSEEPGPHHPTSIELAYRDAMASRARQGEQARRSLQTAGIVLGTAFLLGVTLAMIV